MPRSAIMITRSLKLNLKLVYQLTQRMMICLSKCRPLNNASTETNRRILPSSFIAERFAPEPFFPALVTSAHGNLNISEPANQDQTSADGHHRPGFGSRHDFTEE